MWLLNYRNRPPSLITQVCPTKVYYVDQNGRLWWKQNIYHVKNEVCCYM